LNSFNDLTGNSGNCPWRIGRAEFDVESLALKSIVSLISASSLTGDDTSFVADPFRMVTAQGEFVFAEAWSQSLQRGQIAAFLLGADGAVVRSRIVLAEPFHLSYPCVFEYEGECFMIPEAWESGYVSLYRAVEFPWRWKKWREILRLDYGDPQIVRHDGYWYIFLNTDPLANRIANIFWSKALEGPWHSHPMNPVLTDEPSYARSAGSIVKISGRLIRFTQECRARYGAQVCASFIDELSPTSFSMTKRGTVTMTRPLWAKSAFHHLDVFAENGRLYALFDGYSDVIDQQVDRQSEEIVN
jgi:hypothetical protein